MNDVTRLLAVCDLFADAPSSLDPEAVLANGAEQVARLTRADLAIAAIDGVEGVVFASYPREMPLHVARALTANHWTARGERTAVLGPSVDDRAAGFTRNPTERGVLAAFGPIDGDFSSLDEWLVMVAARRLESQLKQVEQHKRLISDAEIVRDYQLAGELQQALLPQSEQQIGSVKLSGRIRPAREVGGDTFDMFDAAGTAIGLIADVAGKGAPAWILTAAVSSAARHAVLKIGAQPARILAEIESEIAELLDRTGKLVTVAVAAIETTGAARIASAGHSPVVVHQRGSSSLVEPGCPPLGVGSFPIPEQSFVFASGDFFLLASDGIIDQRRPDGLAHGTDRLLSHLAGSGTTTASGLTDEVFARLHDFSEQALQDDDQTALAMLFAGDGQ